MKANEFIKKHGVAHAKAVIHGAIGFFDYLDCEKLNYVNVEKCDCVAISELQRLVESHDLVESLGGLEKAKELLVEVANRDHRYAQDFEKPALEKAIADVEACQ